MDAGRKFQSPISLGEDLSLWEAARLPEERLKLVTGVLWSR